MEKNVKKGQYLPSRGSKKIPKGKQEELGFNSNLPNARAPDMSPTVAKPVTAKEVAKATMERSDEYVKANEDFICKKIKTFTDAVNDIPTEIPVKMSEEVEKKLDEHKKLMIDTQKKIDQLDDIKKTINGWLHKGLGFVVGIVAFSFLLVQCAANKGAKADRRFKEADMKWKEAQAVINSMDSLRRVRDTYHDFGYWMIRRYGDYGSDYVLFQEQYEKYKHK